jgi:hypothetical protein
VIGKEWKGVHAAGIGAEKLIGDRMGARTL